MKIKSLLITLLLFIVTSSCVFASTSEYKFNYDELCKTDDLNKIVTACKSHSDDFYYLVFAVTHEESYKPTYQFRTVWHTYIFPKHDFVIDDLKYDGYAYNLRLKVARGYVTKSGGIDRIDSICSTCSSQYLGTTETAFKEYLTNKKLVELSFSQRILVGDILNEKNANSFSLVATNCNKLRKLLKPFSDFKNEISSEDDSSVNNNSQKNNVCDCPKFLKPILSNLEEINKFLKNKKDNTDNEYLIKIYSVLQNSISKSVLDISSTTKQIIDKLTDFQNRFEHLLEEVKKFHMDFKSFSNKIDERLKFISEQMTTLDHDDDHPDQYSILITTQQILNYLQEHLRDLKVEVSGNSGGSSGSSDGGGSSGSSSTIPTDDVYAQHNGWLSQIHNDMTNANDYLDQMLQSMGKNFTIKLIGGFQEVQKDYSKYLETIIKKLDIIIDLLKNMIGNKKDLENSIDNMQDAFKDLMDQPIFDNKDTQKAFNDTYSSFNGSKKFPTLSAEFMPGVKLKYFDLSPFTGLMHTIRDILEAILWISLFLYMIRVFIPKLKI